RQKTSGILLILCAVIAMMIANSPLHHHFEHLLHTKLAMSFGEHLFSLSLHHWINEALMALFFFVMGLELKREFMVGELSRFRQALLPMIAAVGGMIMPAVLYLTVNYQGEAVVGWGIPMATDIAFAIGVLSLLGDRVPRSLLTFLIALAIVDDLGAVVVIALFYTAKVNLVALAYALLVIALLAVMNLVGIRRVLPYSLVGILLWLTILSSGIHATIAGVVLAFCIPIRPKYDVEHFINRVRGLSQQMKKSLSDNPDIIHNDELRTQVTAMSNGVMLVQAPAQKLEHALHLPVAYLIIPLFALANAGIPIAFGSFFSDLALPVTLGIIFGLFAGKLLGIVGFTFVAMKMGIVSLPKDLNMRHIIGVGLLGGIGFTMSIFIADLGFQGQAELLQQAKTGIIFSSLLSGLSGYFWIARVCSATK
ncbi:MAG: Na+/H+ antiporter NhaA, partial [Pseudomonadales bacterium]|nr:Na+/H+ antiporter NhaA [Pseudomonadales bacterium]